MIKQIAALIALSIVLVLGMSYAQQGLEMLIGAYNWVSDLLSNVFSGGQAGNILRGLIALLAIPVLVGLVPTAIYYALKRSKFPYFMEIVWVMWLIQAGALTVINKGA